MNQRSDATSRSHTTLPPLCEALRLRMLSDPHGVTVDDLWKLASTLEARVEALSARSETGQITQAASESAGVSHTSGMESSQAGERPAPDGDAERYQWFRDCGLERQADIVEAADGKRHMLDHHIDKGRCGL